MAGTFLFLVVAKNTFTVPDRVVLGSVACQTVGIVRQGVPSERLHEGDTGPNRIQALAPRNDIPAVLLNLRKVVGVLAHAEAPPAPPIQPLGQTRWLLLVGTKS